MFISAVPALSETIPYPIIQYHETDWEFIKRVASQFGASLFPHFKYGEPQFYLGLPVSKKTFDFGENYTACGLSDRFYLHGGQQSAYSQDSFFYYKVQSKENMNIGDTGDVDGTTMRVVEKQTLFVNSEVIYEYILAQEEYADSKLQYNEIFSGLTILGTVIETEKETLKIHLDIDETQDTGTAHPYAWVPASGNFMYLMPQVGTRVSLYFSNQCESSAKAVGCVRTNGDSEMMADPSQRRLLTEHGKQMHLYPESMGFTSEREGTPLTMMFDDTEGVIFSSHNKLDIFAVESILIEAPVVTLSALSQIQVVKADIAITGGGDVPYNVIADPISCFDMFNLTQMQGGLTNYTAWEFNYFDPFEDAPTKGKFNGWGLVGKIIAGIVIAVAVGAVVFFTGGAALAAIPALAASSTTIAAALGIGVGAFGIGVTGVTGYTEFQSGNAIPLYNYIIPTIKVGGAVMSIVSLIAAPWTIPIALGNLAALMTNLFSCLGRGGALALVGGGTTGGAIALTQADSILAALGLLLFAKSGGFGGGNSGRKTTEPKYKTDAEAKKAAEELGYKDTGKRVHRDGISTKIFENTKGDPRYITRDADGHNGGVWKGADKPTDFSADNRVGTYDEFLNWIKG